eukprot:6558858-Prymnesium_polylepis.1
MATHLVRPTTAQRPRCRGPACEPVAATAAPPSSPAPNPKAITPSHQMPLQLTPPKPLVTNELHRGPFIPLCLRQQLQTQTRHHHRPGRALEFAQGYLLDTPVAVGCWYQAADHGPYLRLKRKPFWEIEVASNSSDDADREKPLDTLQRSLKIVPAAHSRRYHTSASASSTAGSVIARTTPTFSSHFHL